MSPEKEMTPTDRLFSFGPGLAANSDSVERVPRGRPSEYGRPGGCAHASFLRSLTTFGHLSSLIARRRRALFDAEISAGRL